MSTELTSDQVAEYERFVTNIGEPNPPRGGLLGFDARPVLERRARTQPLLPKLTASDALGSLRLFVASIDSRTESTPHTLGSADTRLAPVLRDINTCSAGQAVQFGCADRFFSAVRLVSSWRRRADNEMPWREVLSI